MELKTKTNIILEISEEEAIWLKDIVQNPLYGEYID